MNPSMDVKTSKFHRSGVLLVVLALTLCTGLLHATNQLPLTPGTVQLTCNTANSAIGSATATMSVSYIGTTAGFPATGGLAVSPASLARTGGGEHKPRG